MSFKKPTKWQHRVKIIACSRVLGKSSLRLDKELLTPDIRLDYSEFEEKPAGNRQTEFTTLYTEITA